MDHEVGLPPLAVAVDDPGEDFAVLGPAGMDDDAGDRGDDVPTAVVDHRDDPTVAGEPLGDVGADEPEAAGYDDATGASRGDRRVGEVRLVAGDALGGGVHEPNHARK